MLPARVGLGTLRLPDDATFAETISAALASGISIFDTARAYGERERQLGAALSQHPQGHRAFVVSKCGMARPDGKWQPDGRASSLMRDCDASLRALERPIDLYLLHAPDPRVKWATTVRALGRLLDEHQVRAVGLCNVTLAQLDEALALAPIAAVQLGLSLLDDRALASGVLERCRERGIAFLAHSALGGPRRAKRLLRTPLVREIAERHSVSEAAVALAALLNAHREIAVLAGPRNPESARQIAEAQKLDLDEEARARLAESFTALHDPRVVAAQPGRGEVMLIMGLPGAGKSRAAEELVAKGYERLNRDELGGSLAGIAKRLDAQLAAGSERLVLDNTYLTRSSRAAVLRLAARHGMAVHGIFIDVSLGEAQVNVVQRMLDAHDRLLEPTELVRLRTNSALSPTSLWRVARTLERPQLEEGFTSLETRPFVADSARGRPARFVALELVEQVAAEEARDSFVVGWSPNAATDLESRLAARFAAVALCRHGGGPPSCWCRPPLPGLLLALARTHALNLSQSELVGLSPAHRQLAAAVGMRFVQFTSKD